MKLLEMMQNRRSVRQYTKEPIPEELLTEIVQAGLLSASGRGGGPGGGMVGWAAGFARGSLSS